MTLRELNDAGYDIIEGDYRGTPDDRAGRWYVVKTGGPSRKWGTGHASKAAALTACHLDTDGILWSDQQRV